MKHLTTPTRTALVLATLALAFAAGILAAGPLNPPPGAVTSNYKTLTEVEPRIAISLANTPGDATNLFKITQPGSYYLTGNVTGVAAKNGIGIASSGVTLDLNGFELIGVPSSLDGVSALSTSGLINIAVLNGSAHGWGSDGVDLQDLTGIAGCRVQGVRASANFSSGIRVGSFTSGSSGSVISQCTATSNLNFGIVAGIACTLTDCTSTGNGSNGINTEDGCTILGCTSSDNGGSCIKVGPGSTISNTQAKSTGSSFGIDAIGNCSLSSCAVFGCDVGIRAGGGSTLSNCSVQACSGATGTGISCGLACSLTNCSALGCSGGGMITQAGSSLTSCSATGNTGVGVSGTGNGTTLTGCSANANLGGGILSGFGCTISSCTANQNTGNGIAVGGNSSVLDCTARLNTLDGIIGSFRCTIKGNTCGSNSLAQIHLTDTDNRIEANTCASGATGFDVDLGGNFIVRNSCATASTNWSVAAGNVCLVVQAVTGAAINGSIGGAAPGSTDPNANFSY